jgi:hypothetical protein
LVPENENQVMTRRDRGESVIRKYKYSRTQRIALSGFFNTWNTFMRLSQRW